MTVNRNLIVPGLGVAVFLLAYLAQNVWGLFHVEEIAQALRRLPWTGLFAAIFLIGLGEGTVVLGLYLPGTAAVILLLVGIQPSWDEALPLLASLMAGTLVGYAASLLLGRTLRLKLPALVGESQFYRVRSLIERYGLASVVPAAIHPNQLALAFAILGYFSDGRAMRYFMLAVIAQAGWWTLYTFLAGFIAKQSLMTSSNFQLYVAACFFAWFLYELLWRRQPGSSVP